MEEKYTFGDKTYTKQEVIDYGRSHYPRVSRVVTRSVGLGMFGVAYVTCFLGGCAMSLHADAMTAINFSLSVTALIAGIVLLICSRIKPNDEKCFLQGERLLLNAAIREAKLKGQNK